MTPKLKYVTVFAIIPFALAVLIPYYIGEINAIQNDAETQCREGQVLVYRAYQMIMFV